MASTTKPAPTSVDIAAVAIGIREKLGQTHLALVQLEEDAADLVELLIDHRPFVGFNTPLINAAGELGRAIGEVSVDEPSKQVSELR